MWGAINLWFFSSILLRGASENSRISCRSPGVGACEAEQTSLAAGPSDVNLLSWHLSTQTITFKLLFPARAPALWFTSRSSNYLAFFISECVCELQTCCAPLSALLPLLSLPSPLAGTGRVKGGRASVCQVGLVLQPQQQHTVIRVGRKQPLRLGSIKL